MKDISIPLRLIKVLSDGETHSGQQLGQELGMSRAAINKHIQTIREWGVEILTLPGKGYHFPAPMNLLDKDIIANYLPNDCIAVIPVIDSTNQYLLDQLASLNSGDACVAEYQYAGRGRRGRQWVSAFGRNLYLSMYWRLDQGPAAAVGLSLVVGIVIAEVLNRLGAERVKVKWPNDLYLDDKKLAGILVELTGKTGDAAQIVIGIGMNISMSSEQQELINQQWTNLQQAGMSVERNKLIAEIIVELKEALLQFENEGLVPFISRWLKLDNFINRKVKLIIGEQEIYGIARGIDQQGALLLDINGVITPHIGGEISLRGC
ncbi:bifunctional biotin--[acetyl-CoA-carboxylase] ligase/biotin operon repressor BirA [Xenorhabdus nematophila]|uniref:Bifunctional ligase/repressor BirA n=1 Tax=Xenorhabdus nematophila (strain ATCC 19061 / DSM 3370 / CCUG 14189 / LMG 1036 / NCIMB 9965 / AN6) TaxID=406817 RepID=D3VHN2_XENNA|nr:bifunctional biotin--[acetyl-CoA-carboxylase] ligase/biotin operon repressor BirA [Xenorhabdus nematophila]CEE93495.1 bifunctional: biotin-(acetylCoA carboxylase) holoenzyme synthetase; transcriptional repressor of biotin synthesis (BirA family) [Xenorhabdus nematophila str. Anatoliense]CBJ88371.1 bifunctional: biotin-[acetylCoA carboxylase] holoenzyme synthetase; transcriptional repressor of biotin synthesis (BirA family) [Xenorhabdus nematophila ATCC 19061]CCW30660.1 Bifunctional protein Bi